MASRYFSGASFFSLQANKPQRLLSWGVIKGSFIPKDEFLERKLTSSSSSPLSYDNVLKREWRIFLGCPSILLPPTRVFANVQHGGHAVAIASLPGSSQLASGIFTLGTAFVIPFYTLMVFAPRSEWVKYLIQG